MERVKIIVTMIIFCGFIMNFLPDNFSRYAFECVTIFAVCIYALSAVSAGIGEFSFDKEAQYSQLESYTKYVESSQKKLFDNIAAKEKAYEKD